MHFQPFYGLNIFTCICQCNVNVTVDLSLCIKDAKGQETNVEIEIAGEKVS